MRVWGHYSLDRDHEQDREARHPDHEHVHLVEPPSVQYEAHGQHEGEREEVERRLV